LCGFLIKALFYEIIDISILGQNHLNDQKSFFEEMNNSIEVAITFQFWIARAYHDEIILLDLMIHFFSLNKELKDLEFIDHVALFEKIGFFWKFFYPVFE
jgi:high-affinity nickel permease